MTEDVIRRFKCSLTVFESSAGHFRLLHKSQDLRHCRVSSEKENLGIIGLFLCHHIYKLMLSSSNKIAHDCV